MAEKLKKKEKDLQVALIQAVYYGHGEAVKGAGEALNEHFKKYESPKAKKKSRLPIIPGLEGPKQKTTGPQMLDFLVERLYDAEAKTWWKKEIPKKCRSDYNRRSPLMIALQEVVVADTARTEDRTELAKQLIALGASVAFKNKVGLTALHIACSTGQEEMVRLILETAKKQTRFCHRKGDKKNLDSDLEAVLNAKERMGWTALMFAVKEGHLNIVKILMEYDILDYGKENKKQQNVFHVAAREGKLECLEHLCTKSPPELLMTSDWKERNIIHQVCSNGDVKILKWLLDEVSELKTEPYLNKKSKYQTGYTPLLVACLYHKLEIVKFLTEGVLVEEGLVDVTACCHEDKKGRGKNGLHLSAENYAVEVAKQLIKAGCPLDKVDAKGNTVLHIANRRGDYSVARVITAKCLEKEIDLEKEKNDDGKFPSQMVEEVIIPLEIKKRGEDAIEIYTKALNEGKTKIPYCSLLILGRQEVGKTSLYRQLVGKEFLEEIDSTRGIDNNTVDTVDRRNVDTKKEKWLEMEDPDTGEQFGERLAAKVTTELPKKADKEVSDGRSVTEKELLTSIQHIVRDIERLKRPPPPIPPVHRTIHEPEPEFQATPTPAFLRTFPPPDKKVRLSEESPQPPTTPRPSAEVVRDKPPKRAVVPPKPKPSPVPDPTPPPPPAAEVKEHTATPSTSDSKEEEEEDFEPRMLTHRQRSQLDEFIRGKRELPVERSLTLNTLDFAGQKQYRPMHHCFIARRALYLVVFNIDDMLKHISDPQGTSPIEEVRYWIQSINAHIYPPDKSEKEADKAVNRVFLVGTHRGDHSQEELKKIDKLMESRLIYFPESKCVNHIRSMKVDKPTECNGLDYFVAVENSIDCTKGDAYLEESGTKLLQDKIKNVSEKIKFMKEEHPIKWLKFEERLERCGKTRNPPLMKLQEIEKLAVSSRITDEEQQDLALKFFHDTGKIICLKYLPRLFLSREQRNELQDLIVLRPDWLMSVMKVIMELDLKKEDVSEELKSDLIVQLVTKGEANLELLDFCWEELISPSKSPPESGIIIDIRHLCLILQAYCLIYPVQSVDGVDGNNSNGDAKQSRKSKYIIPCKLPEKIEGQYRLPNSSTFFFDFNGFLPAEIYHRLICLATRDAKPPSNCPNLYSSKKCLFWKLEKTNWIMEMDSEKHRLCFRVIAKKPKEEYIQFIHDRLCEICEDSRLEGVVYYGGPEIDCKPCKKTVLLHCVEYNNGDTGPLTCKPECSVCLTEYDINDLPVKDPPEVVASDSKQPCTSHPALGPGPDTVTVSLWEREWELAHLQLIKYVDPRTGRNEQIKIAVELAPSWKEIATFMGLSNAEISAIESAGAGKTVHTCLTEVFGRWQSNSVNLKYPDTWKGVYRLLNDSSRGNLARSLKVALDAETSNIIGNYPEDLQTHAPATSNGSPHSGHDPTHKANGTSGASPIPQTTTGRKKMNDDEVANWLEGEGVNIKDIQILKKHGVNERLFLDLSQDSPELKDVSEATKRQISGLQEDMKSR